MKRSRRSLRTMNLRLLARSEDGTALIEGAIVVPVLCVLLFGVYEFSWFFYQQHLVSTGLRDAARYLAHLQAPCNSTLLDWPTEQTGAKNLATTGSFSGGNSRVKGWTTSAIRIDCKWIDNTPVDQGLSSYRGGRFIYVVTASTRFRDRSLGLFGFLGLQSPVIAVSHSERVIGAG